MARTFMLKEIHEQPDAVAETITDRLPSLEGVDLSDVELDEDFLRDVERIVIVACGTSYHAGLVGRYAIEQGPGSGRDGHRIGVPLPGPRPPAERSRHRRDAVGETADTLAAMRLARESGSSKVLAITNVMGQPGDPRRRCRPLHPIGDRDQRRRDEDLRQPGRRHLPARPSARRASRDLRAERISELVAELKSLPSKLQEAVTQSETSARAIARAEHGKRFFMYIGRHIGLAVCLEGALKLKEISYIPADAYAAAR